MMTIRNLQKRDEVKMLVLDQLVPEKHMVRKLDKYIDLSYIYEMVSDSYCDNNGRPSVDPVVLVKIAIIKKIFGISSLRKTLDEIKVNVAYRWYIGYGIDEPVPHFTTYIKNYARIFGDNELFGDFFERVLGMCIGHKLINPEAIFIDATHVKASANKNKYTKEQIKASAKYYQDELEDEINEMRKELGKAPLKKKEPEFKEVTVSKTDPDSGMFFKSEKERCFAYSAHTACDERGFVVGIEVTAGNVHDSVMTKALVDQDCNRLGKPEYVIMDAGYRTAANAKMLASKEIQAVLPYKRIRTQEGMLSKREFLYDEYYDWYICPQNEVLTLKTIDREGYKHYKSSSEKCKSCPLLTSCTRDKKGIKTITRHLWQDYLDETDHFRLTNDGKMLYQARKETIERAFADVKENHSMRYTRLKGRRKVTQEVFLTFACLNLKKMIKMFEKKGLSPYFFTPFLILLRKFYAKNRKNPLFRKEKVGFSALWLSLLERAFLLHEATRSID